MPQLSHEEMDARDRSLCEARNRDFDELPGEMTAKIHAGYVRSLPEYRRDLAKAVADRERLDAHIDQMQGMVADMEYLTGERDDIPARN